MSSTAGDYTNHTLAEQDIKQWNKTNEKIRNFQLAMKEAESHTDKPVFFALKHFRLGDAFNAIKLKITRHKNADIMKDIQTKIKAEFTVFITKATEHNSHVIKMYKKDSAQAEQEKANHLAELQKIEASEKRLKDLISQFEEHQNQLAKVEL